MRKNWQKTVVRIFAGLIALAMVVLFLIYALWGI